MRFQCEHCQGISAVGPEDFGRQVRCGHCSDVSNVPETRYSKGAVIDDFVLDRRIGQGAMGTVYLAHQISLDRPVALKVLRDDKRAIVKAAAAAQRSADYLMEKAGEIAEAA